MRILQKEFRARYEKSGLRKAGLVQGKVRMPSPVSGTYLAVPHNELLGWFGTYKAYSPNVEVGNNTSVILDANNEVQPEALLPKKDGACIMDANEHLQGPPELVGEISNTTLNFDTNEKKEVRKRCGV